MTYVRRKVRCERCKRDRPHVAFGLCGSCYRRRWPRCDSPTGNPGGRGVSRAPDEVASRIEDYALLRSDRSVTRAEAARRVGISYKTAERYDRRLNEESTR
jgi:primosomal protein N'